MGRKVIIDIDKFKQNMKAVCFAAMFLYAMIGLFILIWHSVMPEALHFLSDHRVNHFTLYVGGLVIGFAMGYCYRDYKAVQKDE